jgi:hypothetical protein
MEAFLARYRHLVTGVLCGFDRLVFRGSLLLTAKGHLLTAALFAARDASIKQLLANAA